MNLQQMRCVLEISRVGSVTKAAQNLYISQPNMSRTVKELEKELGVTLFHRGIQGMEPTVEAAQFLRYAETIIRQMDELESIYQTPEGSTHFSLAGPRSGYIIRGLSAFLAKRAASSIDVQYLELSTQKAMEAVSHGQVQIAVVRYQMIYDDYFKELFAKAGLASRTLLKFTPCLLLSKNHPLARSTQTIDYEQLQTYTRIVRGDMQLAVDENGKVYSGSAAFSSRRINVYDRASMYELLRGVLGSYAWSNPLPEVELKRYGLVQRRCRGAGMNRDVVLWQAKHGLGPVARDCLVVLQETARRQNMLAVSMEREYTTPKMEEQS